MLPTSLLGKGGIPYKTVLSPWFTQYRKEYLKVRWPWPPLTVVSFHPYTWGLYLNLDSRNSASHGKWMKIWCAKEYPMINTEEFIEESNIIKTFPYFFGYGAIMKNMIGCLWGMVGTIFSIFDLMCPLINIWCSKPNTTWCHSFIR